MVSLFLQAEEQTAARRSATARLHISVLAEDSSPPVLSATATEGFVSENAEVGTRVKDARGNDILFVIRDEDDKVNRGGRRNKFYRSRW